MAFSQKRPLIYLTSSKLPKEQRALEVLKNDPVSEGLVCILSVVENCQTFQPMKQENGLLELRSVTRKCKYYYFYFLDKNFGFMHVKLQTWFPFMIQVYINGHELMKPKSWLKSVSAFANGIGGTLFFGIDDERNLVGLADA